MMITAAETYRLLYARDSSSVMQRCGFVFGLEPQVSSIVEHLVELSQAMYSSRVLGSKDSAPKQAPY
jgi:hypothetical protein